MCYVYVLFKSRKHKSHWINLGKFGGSYLFKTGFEKKSVINNYGNYDSITKFLLAKNM